jgi:HPt (histidine-containing phosphotransfer) domain-containing protein
MTVTQGVLDQDILGELLRLARESGNSTFLDQLVAIFRTNAPARLAQIREALAGGHASALEHAAHTLRSNCSMLGAMRMAEYCGQFETLAGRGDLAAAAVLLPAAEAEFAAVMAAVETIVTPQPPAGSSSA